MTALKYHRRKRGALKVAKPGAAALLGVSKSRKGVRVAGGLGLSKRELIRAVVKRGR